MKNFVTKKSFYITVLSITLPIALQNLIAFGVSMTDTVMLGRLGDVQLSAAAQANQPGFVFQLFIFGLAGGGSVLCSQYWGKQNIEAVKRIIGIVLRVAIIVSVVLSIFVFSFPREIMMLYLKNDSLTDNLIISEAASYLKIIALSYLFFGISLSFSIVIRSVQIVIISLIVSIISFCINVFLNWVLIFGNLGAPEMGIRGASLATLIARITEFLVIFIYAFFLDKKLKFKIKYIVQRDKILISDFIKYSGPVVANELAWALGITIQAAILGKLSTQVLAANSIAMIMQQLVTILIFGVAQAASVLVGKQIGEGDLSGARSTGITVMIWSIILGAIGSISIFILRKPFISIYNIQPEIQSLAEDLMIITSVLVFFVSVSCNSIVGVLRGAGDTKYAFRLEMSALWLVALPLGAIAGFVFDAPILITYAFLKIDEPIKSILAFIRTTKSNIYKSITRD